MKQSVPGAPGASGRGWSAKQFRLVVCKLSGLGMFDHGWTQESIGPIVGTCVELFGDGRIMVGSNFPVDSLASTCRRTFDAFSGLLAAEAHSAAFGGTAARFFQCRVRPPETSP